MPDSTAQHKAMIKTLWSMVTESDRQALAAELFPAAATKAAPAQLLKPQEAAKYLNCSYPWFWKLMKAGKIQVIPIGKRDFRVSREALDKFCANQTKSRGGK
jgi:excisionase family DNA binding protein